jgi:hypothetical protein
VPCDKVASLPDFTFIFDGNPYPIASTDYILNLGGTCVSSFTGMDISPGGSQLWIVGTYQLPSHSGHLADNVLQVTSSYENTSLFMTSAVMLSASPQAPKRSIC